MPGQWFTHSKVFNKSFQLPGNRTSRSHSLKLHQQCLQQPCFIGDCILARMRGSVLQGLLDQGLDVTPVHWMEESDTGVRTAYGFSINSYDKNSNSFYTREVDEVKINILLLQCATHRNYVDTPYSYTLPILYNSLLIHILSDPPYSPSFTHTSRCHCITAPYTLTTYPRSVPGIVYSLVVLNLWLLSCACRDSQSARGSSA